MLAEMHDGMGIEMAPDPEIESQIVVWRHQVWIMVGALGIDVVTPRGLYTDDDVAKPVQSEPKAAVDDMGVLLRPAPTRLDGALHVVGQLRERGLVVGDRPRHTNRTDGKLSERIVRAGLEKPHHRRGIARHVVD